MVKTITLNLASRISQDVSVFQESVSQAGARGRAVQDIGQSIARTGAQLGSLFERRRAAEDRDEIFKQKSIDSLQSKQELADIKDEFRNDFRGANDALQKTQLKRHQKILKGVQSSTAREQLDLIFQNSRMESSISAVSFEREQFSKISQANIVENANLQAVADSQNPDKTIKEFIIDLDSFKLDIKSLDTDDVTIASLDLKATDTMVRGMIRGYTKGGEIQDFDRARVLIDELGNRLTIKQVEFFQNKITKDETSLIRKDNRTETREAKKLAEDFEEDVSDIEDIVEALAEDPNADISNDLEELADRGKLADFVGTPQVFSRQNMGVLQKTVSTQIALELMEALSEDDDVSEIREELRNTLLGGQLSSDDADQVLQSVKTFDNSDFRRAEFKKSKFLINEAVPLQDVASVDANRVISRQRQALHIEVRSLVVESGLSPALATKVVLKDRGLFNLASMPKVSNLVSDQDSLASIGTAKREVSILFKEGRITVRQKLNAIRLLNKRQTSLEVIPTVEEIKARRK